MNFADLHCDTANELVNQNTDLFSNKLHISLDKTNFNNYIQTFALWTYDGITLEQARMNYQKMLSKLHLEFEKNSDKIALCKNYNEIKTAFDNNKYAGILAVEGGGIIGEELDFVDKMHSDGVRFVTVTWNGANTLASGCMESEDRGITEFGKKTIKKFNEVGIIPDVSHLGEKGFWDLCEISDKAFIATHSNAYSLCNHVRNLKNEQICEIIKRRGLIGMNLYSWFINNTDRSSIDEMITHIEYILSLGGIDVLAIGSDFDGIETMPCEMQNIRDIGKLPERMLQKNFPEKTVKKIMFDNFMRFAEENL